MPHCFQLTIPHLEVSRKSIANVGEFIEAIFTDGSVKVGQTRVGPKGDLKGEVPDDELSLGGLKLEDVAALMKKEIKLWKEQAQREKEIKEAGKL